MSIKCPICETEYEDGSVRFCRICMYSIGADRYLTDLLSHPSEDDLRIYNESIEEYRVLWVERNSDTKKGFTGMVEMVQVDGGTFRMGSNAKYSDANPGHKVTLDSFLIAKYVVTQELWVRLMGSNPSKFKGTKRPVEQILWYDAIEFCNILSEKEGLNPAYAINKYKKDLSNKNKDDDREWLVKCNFKANGYRLPTEAEWEYAARGGNKSKSFKYSGTNVLKEVGWYGAHRNRGNRTKEEGTSDVGRKKSNELGLYDMSGNVSEWCWDWYGYYNVLSQINPSGPKTGSSRVFRGGNWYDEPEFSRVMWRCGIRPDGWGENLGFRLARTKS